MRATALSLQGASVAYLTPNSAAVHASAVACSYAASSCSCSVTCAMASSEPGGTASPDRRIPAYLLASSNDPTPPSAQNAPYTCGRRCNQFTSTKQAPFQVR